MNLWRLARRGLLHYWRTNLAVIAGVAIAVAVLSGALLVGQSVRSSLRDLALARIGRFHYAITGTGFFREALAERDGCPIITFEAVVTHEPSGRRAAKVLVYGVDQRFGEAPTGRGALLTPALLSELGAKAGDALLVRVEKPSPIPLESMHGRKQDNGRTLRLTARGGAAEFALRPQQGDVKAVFVPLRRLQVDLDLDGKANALLATSRPSLANYALEDIGIKMRDPFTLETESAIVSDELAAAIFATAQKLHLETQSIFSYLANTIRIGDREIPYSLVTALPLPGDGLVLNEWAARDLAARPGDAAQLDYYVWKDEGRLATESVQVRVQSIVPIAGQYADRNYAPEYPGISDADTLHDWDPPFPVDLKRIRPRDEQYWHQYRTTPKAFLPLAAGQKLWGTRYGKLTSVRLSPPERRGEFEAALRAALDPAKFGLTVMPLREIALQAAQGSTDFGEYFLYFSFFLIASALLLTGLFFRLGVEQRQAEIALLGAVGFAPKRIRGLFLREGIALASIGSLLGALLSVAYAAFILFGLRTWWIGAVGTRQLRLHIDATSLVTGIVAGVCVALATVAWALRARRPGARRVLAWAGFVPLAAAIACLFLGGSAGFFGAGTLLLIAALLFTRAWLIHRPRHLIQTAAALGLRSASVRPGRSVLTVALIASAVFLIVSVDAFHQDANPRAGDYPYIAESLLSLVPETLPQLPGVKYVPFRLRPGDDASCLNLYRPQTPRVLGVPDSYPIPELRASLPDGVIPAVADATSLEYALHRKIGDEIVIAGQRLRLVAALRDSIFQDAILIPERDLLRVFPEVEGYRFFLMKAPPQAVGQLEESLADYGFDVTSASDRLAAFHRVENTYLSTFQALGMLGLLLGTAGLAAVILRNVLERRRELALLRAVGYEPGKLAGMILAENLLLLLAGLATGTVCALIASAPVFVTRVMRFPVLAIALLLLTVLSTGLLSSWLAARAVIRSELLPALRSE